MRLTPLKVLTAGLGLIAASQAHAVIEVGNTANLFVAAWDPARQVGYVRDLGINIQNFLPPGYSGSSGNRPVNQFGTPPTTSFAFGAQVPTQAGSVLTQGYEIRFGLDPLFTDFLAASDANGSKNGVVWNVGAIDNVAFTVVSPTIPANRNFLVTSNANQATIQGMQDTAFSNAMSQSPGFVTGNNTLGTHATQQNGSSTNVPGSNAYFPNVWGTNLGSFASFSTATTLGNSLGFWAITDAGNGANVSALRFGAGSWKLDTAGVLVYAVAVPEPGTYALLAAGLVMLGGIVRRRMS